MSLPVIIAALAASAVGIIFFGVWQLREEGERKANVAGRMHGRGDVGEGVGGAAAKAGGVLRDTRLSHIPFLNDMLSGLTIAGAIRLWILQSRLKTPPGAILLLAVFLAVVGAFTAWWATEGIGTSIAVGAIGGSIPLLVVERRRKKRFRMFAQQLPDGLTMMKNSLQAGHTLDKAMIVVSEELPDPIGLEFRETAEEMHLGMPVKRVMENFSNRVIDENLNIFVAAMLVQREIGGNLTELLGNLAATIRERFRVEQEVKALTAEGRVSGYVIGALPIALAIIINMMQPEYLEPLYKTEKGLMLLKGAVALNVIGFYFIRKLCKVNF